jgi:HK97 family phage portal protein
MGLAKILSLSAPRNWKVTRYRLIESLVSDMGIYFNAYWLKFYRDNKIQWIIRIPPIYVTVKGGIVPTKYEINMGGKQFIHDPDDIVHFRGYNPENPTSGLSPLETLRRVLAEEHASGKYREEFWNNSARMGGIVQRPVNAPEWSDPARNRWLAEFSDLYSGEGKGGKIAVLEEGMEFNPNTFNAQESEYLGGRKLTREECARAYHIPLPMVGILDNATFSNITEQHKNLYQDSLGPWASMIEQEIELQLLYEFEDIKGVYVEFNIAEKLQGSFEEQATIFQSAVGRPWMTPDEARARMNLPKLGGDAELLATPLNVLIGGQASPRDSLPKGQKSHETKGIDSANIPLREQHEKKWVEMLVKHYKRQERFILPKIPPALNEGKSIIGDSIWFDDERWDEELMLDIFRLNTLTATEWAKRFAELLETEISEDRMSAWLYENARIMASNINGQVKLELEAALNDPDPMQAVKNLFLTATTVWAFREAVTAVTNLSNFGAHEASNAAGLRTKTWRVNSSNPRPSHAMMHGETVGIRERFSNGLRWPGDASTGNADEVANCHCSVEFSQ